MKIHLIVFLPLTALVFALIAAAPKDAPKFVALAKRLLDSFQEKQKAAVAIGYDDRERFNWHYVPRRRSGVAYKEMSTDSRAAMHDLLHSALSASGYGKAIGIMRLDQVLHEIEGGNPMRDPEAYNLMVFGQPDEATKWAWRFEGHHLSLNFTLAGGDVVSSTPQFFGANPARVKSGSDSGLRTLAPEEDLGRRLLTSLSESDRSRAIIAAAAPSEILTRASRSIDIGDPTGLPYRAMSAAQQRLLLELIDVYIGRLAPSLAARKRHELQEGLDSIHFAWAGGQQPGVGHYYRVHGLSILIEYDNTQNGANHIHTVIRDPKNDFGEDPLRTHYAEKHSH